MKIKNYNNLTSAFQLLGDSFPWTTPRPEWAIANYVAVWDNFNNLLCDFEDFSRRATQLRWNQRKSNRRLRLLLNALKEES